MRNILLNIVLSIAIIFVAHQIWDYLKHNYTTQKTKNVVEIHAAKYKQMMEDLGSAELGTKKDERMSSAVVVKQDLPHPLAFLSIEEKEWIQKELDGFIDSL